MKKITGIILLILIMSAMLFTAVSCGKKTEIAIKEDAMPQLVHVLGEELDLSKGVLNVKNGKKTDEIAMNAEGVEISGYDRNKLGDQTVTISYDGASTTLTVTVVERMQIVEYVSEYLVGDQFDNSKGRLRITRNDGTTYTVILNNSAVSIEGFDTSAPGSGKTVTAKYTGTNESYETTFTVDVYDIDNIKLIEPNKTAYSSHEKGISLDGGRLVLSGNNGKLQRELKLSDTSAGITIEGFDLSVVNEDNTSTTQRINVIYDGETYFYDIKISYTSVSMFNDHAHEFAGFDWESETLPTIDSELGEFALELMAMYIDLSTADAILISNEDLLNVARVAVLYGYNTWIEDVIKFEGAFTYAYDDYYESYSIFVTCNTYEDVKNAIRELKITDRPLYKMYEQLTKIAEIESIYDEIVMYIGTPIIGDTMFTSLIPVFEHMIELHDNYLPLLDDWQSNGFAAHEDDIIYIYEFIVDSGHINTENSWIYEQVVYWYDSENIIKPFDAIYFYYYAQNNWDALCNLAHVTLPSAFLDLITGLDNLMTMLDSIEEGDIYDTTPFFYDYFEFVEYAKTYEFSSDPMIADIYSKLPVNDLFAYDDSQDIYIDTLIDYLYYGYAQIVSTLIELDAFEALMDNYLSAYVIAENNANYLSDPDFAASVEGMTARFLELTTTQQYLFSGAIMSYYYYGAPEFAFAEIDGEYSRYVARFNNYIIEYYKSIFGNDDLGEALTNLLVANEVYSRRFDLQTWEIEFKDRMAAFNAIFNNNELVSAQDRERFESYFGSLRTDCEKVLARIDAGTPVIEEKWQAVFDELTIALKAMDDSSYIIEEGLLDTEGYYFHNVFFAAYERAQRLINYILTEGTPEVIDAYYHELMYVLVYEYDDGTSTSYYHTFEYAFSGLRGYYILYRSYTAGGDEEYNALGFAKFFDLVYDLIIPYFNSMINSDGTIDITGTELVTIMTTYSKLVPIAKAYHLLMEGGVYSTYYGAISQYCGEHYSAKVAKLISAINELEYAHSFYYYYTEVAEGENDSAINKSMNDVKKVYDNLLALYDDGLSTEEAAEFEPFLDIYNYYVELTQQMIAEYDAAN